MKVKALIQALLGLPQDADVTLLWDGAPRSDADGAYLAKSGEVVIGPSTEPAYNDEDRPDGAPTEEEDGYYAPIGHILKSQHRTTPTMPDNTPEQLDFVNSDGFIEADKNLKTGYAGEYTPPQEEKTLREEDLSFVTPTGFEEADLTLKNGLVSTYTPPNKQPEAWKKFRMEHGLPIVPLNYQDSK